MSRSSLALSLSTMETLPSGICFALLSSVRERRGANVQTPTGIVNGQAPRSRGAWKPRLTREDQAYLRGWQSEMESFDRF